MFSVNFTLIPGYEVKVAKGTPGILAFNAQRPAAAPTVTFQSPENFELHIMHNGECHGILKPGGSAGA